MQLKKKELAINPEFSALTKKKEITIEHENNNY